MSNGARGDPDAALQQQKSIRTPPSQFSYGLALSHTYRSGTFLTGVGPLPIFHVTLPQTPESCWSTLHVIGTVVALVAVWANVLAYIMGLTSQARPWRTVRSGCKQVSPRLPLNHPFAYRLVRLVLKHFDMLTLTLRTALYSIMTRSYTEPICFHF